LSAVHPHLTTKGDASRREWNNSDTWFPRIL
jgi:hypothetical protein